MRTIILTIAISVVCCMLNPFEGQAQMQGKKYDNPKWKTVEMLEVKHGKMDRVREIISNYFIKAANKAGSRQPAMILEPATGEWNMILVWDMKEGIEELNWEVRPDDVKWMAAMNEIAGSADKAKTILDEWSSLVVRSTSYLCRQLN
jgi:hypothetical protein